MLTPLLVKGQVLQQMPAAGQDTTLAAQDSVTLSAPRGDIATTIKYAARDSIIFEVDREVVHLYGDAKINYGTMSLDAAYIEIDYETNMLTATTLADTTGKEVGVPVFTDGGETYAAKRIAYNYKSRRGRISEVVTQQGEGYIHAEVVKRNDNNEFFGLHSRYTTCNLEHPHFYIGSEKFKVIPNDKVMSGPFNLVIGDIPTPLGFLFGLFPTPKAQKRSSGIQVPSFGENTRGFYLQDLGYYFAWNDYMGTLVQADIYSLGGYNIDTKTDYVKRYGYRGSFGVQYNFLKNDEADIAFRARSTNDNVLPETQRSIWINWTHTPVQKPGRGRFSASVRAGTPGHQRVNYNSTANYLAAQFNSSVSYQKTIPNSPFSYTLNARQSQSNSIGSNSMTFVLPDLSMSMTTVSLYELFSDAPSTGAWYENFTIGYNLRARNEVSTINPARSIPGLNSENVIGESLADTIPLNFNNLQRLWESGNRQADHNLSIGLGNYKVFRFFNFSPSVSYSESWLDHKYTYRFEPDSQRVDVDTTNFGRVYQYSAGASLSTTIYGTAYIKGKRVEAIRHLVRPSISYNYRPDFGNARFGFYQDVLTGLNTDNTARYQTLSRFRSGAPGSSMSSAMGFSIDNNLEMKVRSKSDTATAETKFEKVTLINNLRLSSGYDFAADSFKLAPIRLTMNTRLFKLVDVTLASSFDPYTLRANDAGSVRRVDEYHFDITKLRLARLTSANLNLRTNLNPKARKTETTSPTNLPNLQQDMDPLLPEYIDFKIPWTLSLDYTLNYTRNLVSTTVNRVVTTSEGTRINQTMGINGTLGVTEKWQVSYGASYDFVNQNIAHANVNIHRDLHCWDMSIGWVPFGIMRGYNVTINARSALLRDLKLTKRSRGNGLYQ